MTRRVERSLWLSAGIILGWFVSALARYGAHAIPITVEIHTEAPADRPPAVILAPQAGS